MKLPYVGYTYCIKFLKTGQVYYGSRCAKKCNPSEFWVTYFTSSKVIKKLIEEHSKDSFIFEIRKTFKTNPKDAQQWERRVLRRMNAGHDQRFLNKSNGVVPALSGWKNPFYGKKHSDEIRKLMSELAKERMQFPENNPMYGKKHSEETKEKMSLDRKGISYEGRYGVEKSKKIKAKASEKLSGPNNPMYGKNRSDMVGDLNPMKDTVTKKKHTESIRNRPKINCPHCQKEMDKGGFAVHKRALIKKGLFNFSDL